MAPPILYLKDIHLTFGSTPLLEGAGLTVSEGERLCLVGRNGSGKSTLLKVAAGLIEQDKGERFIQPGTTVRYLPQEPDLSAFETALDYVNDGLLETDDQFRGQYLLEELGLTGDENPKLMSGGEIRRAALARTLAPEPDILLLDEPTNHLDLPAIEWLEKELRSLRSAMVLISHDRRFLENLSRTTLWMDRGESRLLEKGFGAFEDWRDTFFEQEELDRHKLDRKIVREEHWVTHGVSGRRKRNMKRLGDLGKLRQDRAEQKKVAGGVKMTVAEGTTSGKIVVKAKDISKAYDERQIVRDYSIIIQRNDRIGIVGRNGAGKTTLLKLLTGELEPDSGTIKHGANIELLVVDQKREALNPEWTLKDALTDGSGDMVSIGAPEDNIRKHVQSYMKDFLFLPEQARTQVHALSGGERGRLLLAMGLRNPSNFLVLDEPTNDLDLETLDLLQEMIADYPGTVVVVSHDRDFLDRVATSIIALDETAPEGTWIEYAGGYTDMVRQRGATVASDKKAAKAKASETPKQVEQKPEKPKSANTKKLSFKDQHALDTLPAEIEKLEFEIAKLQKALAAPDLFAKEPKKFNTYAKALSEREEKLATSEERWLELEMLQEQIQG